MPRSGWNSAAVGLLLITALAACSGRSAGTTSPDGSTPDASHRDDATTQPDAGMLPDAGAGMCQCSGDEVYRWHECVPTLELGCGPSCVPGVTDCGQYHTCEPCAASSSCDTEDCRPTCVFTGPAQGPVADPLRIEPVWGTAGQSHTITISGFPFYIGALWYAVRLGDEDVTHLSYGGSTCSFHVDAPARPPGMVPIWVSAYGGTDPWVLAGLFTYSGGSTVDCVQPGFPCAPGSSCCSTTGVPLICDAGRCR